MKHGNPVNPQPVPVRRHRLSARRLADAFVAAIVLAGVSSLALLPATSQAQTEGQGGSAILRQQADQLQAQARAMQAEIIRIGSEFDRLAAAVQAQPDDTTGNAQRLAAIANLRAQLAGYRSQIAQAMGIIGSVPAGVPMDTGDLTSQLGRIDELAANIDQFSGQYNAQDAANRAEADARRQRLESLRSEGQGLRSAAVNDPDQPDLHDRMATLITRLDAESTALSQGTSTPPSPEVVAALADLAAQRTALQGQVESLYAFHQIRGAMTALEAEAQDLTQRAPATVPEVDCELPQAVPNPQERVVELRQKIDLQRQYLEERLKLMDSTAPGYGATASALQRFMAVEQKLVEAGAGGVPSRPQMDLFFAIRAAGAQLLATTNAAYELVSPEAEGYVDVTALRRQSEEIDAQNRRVAWSYFCTGEVDEAQARAEIARLEDMHRRFAAVATALVQSLARPEDPQWLVELALAWQTNGDIAAGLKHARRALGLDADGAAPNYAYGHLLLAEGDAGLAAQHLEKAAARDPGAIRIYPSLADAYDALDDAPRALAAAERGLAVDPTQAGLYARAGAAYSDLGQGNDIKVYVQGEKPAFDVPPQVVSGRTMVPFRAVAEALGAQVLWNAATREVVLQSPATEVRLPVGQSHAFVNGRQVALDVPATVVNGRTLIPIRFLGEALGAKVDWLGEWKMVIITHALTR